VLRGGPWNNNANNVRTANRNNNTPDNRNNNIGFRCVVSPSAFLDGQVRRVYGRGVKCLERKLQICSRLGGSCCSTKDESAWLRVVDGRPFDAWSQAHTEKAR
jgi:hypothetical protein